MSEGENPIAHYLSVVAGKTGSLIATSGRFGALMSRGPEQTVEVLTLFGERIGIAYQLSDDLLDVAGGSAAFGKTPGADLREGVATLPVLCARATGDAAAPRLAELLDAGLADDDAAHAEALALLRAHPGLERARAELGRVADEARGARPPARRCGEDGSRQPLRRGRRQLSVIYGQVGVRGRDG